MRVAWLRLLPRLACGCLGLGALDPGKVQAESVPAPEAAAAAFTPALVAPAVTPRKPGPVPPEDLRLWDSGNPPAAAAWMEARRLRIFGWIDGGYTWSDSGDGLLQKAPRPNRFGDEWLLNQAAIVIERTLDPKALSWGFRTEFYCGADAALLRPLNGFGPDDNPRFGTDLRQLYLAVHLPVLSDGGVDVKAGRLYVPLGYESTMAPYRPMYSAAYVWFYSQTGAATGAMATWHVDPQLDVIAGVTMGYNTFFEMRGDGPSYITRAVYWPSEDRRTKLLGTVYTGPQPIASAKGHVADWQTVVEAQVVHDWSKRFTTVLELNIGWDQDDQATGGNSEWYGGYTMGIVHLHPKWDLNLRVEGFGDSDGSRTGTPATYADFAVGFNYMPFPWLNIRPEARLDVSDAEVFGVSTSSERDHHQVSLAVDCLIKF